MLIQGVLQPVQQVGELFLLLLALGFVGYWIYTTAGNEPLVLAPWFLAAAVGLVVLAIVFNILRARIGTDRR